MQWHHADAPFSLGHKWKGVLNQNFLEKMDKKVALKFLLSSPYNQHFFGKSPKFCKILLVFYVQDGYFRSNMTHFQPLIPGSGKNQLFKTIIKVPSRLRLSLDF